MKEKSKLSYQPPRVKLHKVEMEQGIAAGSIAPGSGTEDVVEEWDEEDQEFHFEWDYTP